VGVHEKRKAQWPYDIMLSKWSWDGWQTPWLVAALATLIAGGLLQAFGAAAFAQVIWAGGTVLVLIPTIVSSARRLLRGETGVDLIALLAMAGTLVMGQFLVGAIIAVMLTGGTALERFAVARARRELTALLERAPRVAHRRVGADVVTIDVNEVVLGDWIVVKPGEVVPADGILTSSNAVIDESALTGEARPVTLALGAPVRSGVTNMGSPMELRVSAPAAESTYAGIIRLVKAAETSKAPFVRLADRYALAFVGLTITLAAAAWLLDRNPLRALAVLVVATPCPLILAAPAAIIAGVSRAAKYGIIVKGGGPLETLARVSVLLLDKTGTVTASRPQVVAVESFGELSTDEIVRLAASVEQVSVHPYAPALMAEAHQRHLALRFPSDALEKMGTGISGQVDGLRVAVGQLGWVAPDAARNSALRSVERRTAVEGSSSVYVSVDGRLEGALLLQDPIRAEAPRVLQALRKIGVRRIYLVTGDHPDVADLVGDALGFDRVFSERTPEEKVDVVRELRAEGVLAMVGDGINDAPALALANVGVAMGARGATAAAESADIVLTADRLGGLLIAMRIAQRTRLIALQSVWVGMGLSLVAMGAAAAGYLPPVAGAVLQEGIDVLVIANALRALGGGRLKPPKSAVGLSHSLESAHGSLRPRIEEMATLAARLGTLAPLTALRQLEDVRRMLEEELLPHERQEQRDAFPVIKRLLKNEDPTAPLVGTHHQIQRLARLYARLVSQLPPEGPGPDDLRDLQRALYGLQAILSLHFGQEEELYSLLEP
jgi:heavy metal translocating P-type ATPase